MKREDVQGPLGGAHSAHEMRAVSGTIYDKPVAALGPDRDDRGADSIHHRHLSPAWDAADHTAPPNPVRQFTGSDTPRQMWWAFTALVTLVTFGCRDQSPTCDVPPQCVTLTSVFAYCEARTDTGRQQVIRDYCAWP